MKVEVSCSDEIRRSLMPVRVRIHSSVVSTSFSRSWLVTMREGRYTPVPAICRPDSGWDGIGLGFLVGTGNFGGPNNPIVHPVFDGLDGYADGITNRLHA